MPLLAAFCCSPTHVLATPLLGADLASFSVLAGSYASYGADATINGNVGAVGYISAGAGATSLNNYGAGPYISYGAGASSLSTNTLGAVTVGAGANAGTVGSNLSSVTTALTQYAAATSALTAMGTGTALATTLGGNVSLSAGVYSASALTTAANTVITLDGNGAANPTWVFNITDNLVTGANTVFQFAPGTTNASVLWNAGGYTALGASTSFIGDDFSTTYISQGAGTTSCGGAFSLGYVSMGAGATSGSNCAGSVSSLAAGLAIVNGVAVAAPASISPVPEPDSYAMLLAGVVLLACISRRRKQKNNV